MDRSEIAALAKAVVPFVTQAVADALAPLAARLDALETRPVEKGEAGERGADGPQGQAGPEGPAGPQGLPGVIGAMGPEGPPGSPGAAGELGPPGADGAPGQRGQQGPDGKCGPPGAQGQPGFRGEKGDPGRDGRDAANLAILFKHIDEQITAGLAGISFTSADGGRTLNAALGGDNCGEIKTGIPLDAGVWTEERAYVVGDTVSHGGSMWIAQKATSEKPGRSDDWRLAVKRGADGRDFRPEDKRTPEPVRFK